MSELQDYLDEALKRVIFEDFEEEPVMPEYDIYREAAYEISAARLKMGMTQGELAQKSGISQANISKFETGSSHPTLGTLKKIADGLGKRLVISFEDWEEEF